MIKKHAAAMTARVVGNPAPHPNTKAKIFTDSTGLIDSIKLASSGALERTLSSHASMATAEIAPRYVLFMTASRWLKPCWVCTRLPRQMLGAKRIMSFNYLSVVVEISAYVTDHASVSAAPYSTGAASRISRPAPRLLDEVSLGLISGGFERDALDPHERMRRHEAPPRWQRELRDWLRQRGQVVVTLQAQMLQTALKSPAVRQLMACTIAALTSESAAIDAAMQVPWKAHASPELRSSKGVGLIFQVAILSSLLEVGRLSPRQIAKLVGVAPINRGRGLESLVSGHFRIGPANQFFHR